MSKHKRPAAMPEPNPVVHPPRPTNREPCPPSGGPGLAK